MGRVAMAILTVVWRLTPERAKVWISDRLA
jgi:hypothetical protein